MEVTMKSRLWRLIAAGTAALLSTAPIVHASDRIGVYTRVDKVVVEPDERAPQRVQVWGVFSLADPKSADDYRPAHSGYLYFRLPEAATQALREWADLKAVAGTSQIVAFGSRWSSVPRLRQADEAPSAPDLYPINVGIVKINGRTDYAPVRALISFKP
jgi:hypothetical protein